MNKTALSFLTLLGGIAIGMSFGSPLSTTQKSPDDVRARAEAAESVDLIRLARAMQAGNAQTARRLDAMDRTLTALANERAPTQAEPVEATNVQHEQQDEEDFEAGLRVIDMTRLSAGTGHAMI